MTDMRPVREKLSRGLLLAVVLSMAFMALSFVRTWGDLLSALFGGQIIETTLSEPIWGTTLGMRLMGFIFALVTVHLTLGIAGWLLGHASLRAFPGIRNGARAWTCFWVLALAGWVLVANAALFPYSSLGRPYHDLVQFSFGPVSVFEAATVGLVLALGWVLSIAAFRAAAFLWQQRPAALGLAALPLIVMASPLFGLQKDWDVQRSSMPHVIMIGIDSLRADIVQSEQYALTPAIDEFLSGSVVFTNTTTPLARTFPAWVSIISGRHPHSTGAIINLFPRHLIEEGETLPEILSRAGYETVYGIDEVRFSNLDTSYGFDSMIAPPMGSADFLLGYVYDFPLNNLLVNTRVGRELFPFAHANRAADVTYDPDSYVDLLSDELRFDGPTFLAVHLTLPHWPFTWSSAPIISGDSPEETLVMRYKQSVERADAQVGDILSVLKDRGVLDNAVVVLLSDHGESLGETVAIEPNSTNGGPIFGHGTDVFAREQYHVVLGMRAFGNDVIQFDERQRIDVPVSLEDVAPTIVELLELESDQSFDGWSLAPFLRAGRSDTSEWQDRIRFLETEYNPPGFAVGTSPDASELKEAAGFYAIDSKTDLLSIRPEAVEQILNGRQFAAIHGDSMLATLPTEGNEKQLLVYVDETQSPHWFSGSPDAVQFPVARRLWDSMADRFEGVSEKPVVLPPEPEH